MIERSEAQERSRQQLIDAVKAWREAKCQLRCDECDPSFTCFAGPTVHERYPNAECRKPQALICDGDNHIEGCPVEIARQDMIAAHNKVEQLRAG